MREVYFRQRRGGHPHRNISSFVCLFTYYIFVCLFVVCLLEAGPSRRQTMAETPYKLSAALPADALHAAGASPAARHFSK